MEKEKEKEKKQKLRPGKLVFREQEESNGSKTGMAMAGNTLSMGKRKMRQQMRKTVWNLKF